MPIEIQEDLLKAGAEKGYAAFLNVFTDKYLEVLGGELTAENMSLLNGYQHALLSLRTFTEQMEEGGFIQLIQNGYGPYIFNNPFAKAMRLMGAKDFSKLIYDAKAIYEKNKDVLEAEYTDEEFMALYEQYDNLGDLDDEFLDTENRIMEIVATYVDEHITDFAEVKKD
ncbi:MAG: DMP19 family protein [Phocaeicola sp.]|nr:DMP19 family protein [Phocaeicola sp.]